MYKKIILFAALLAAVGTTANAQWFDFSNNNSDFTVGITLGQAGTGAGVSPAPDWNKPYAGFGIGASVSICGVYIDCLINGLEHQYDNHVISADSPNKMVPDQRAFTVNFGYRIPVLSWLRVAPILGYSQTSYGYCDYSSVNIETNSESSSSRMYHDYIVSEDFDEFNFGGGIFIQPIPYFELSFVGTKRAIYGGIVINLSSLVDEEGE